MLRLCVFVYCVFPSLTLSLSDIKKTEHARSDGIQSENCTSEKLVEAVIGRGLALISKVYPLETCYFIFKGKNGQDYNCCYGEKDSKDFGKTCESSNEYIRNVPHSRCLSENDYELIIDSEGSETCTLVIKSFNETAAGKYKSLSNDHELLQECLVDPAAPVVVEKVEGLSKEERIILGVSLFLVITILGAIFLFKCREQEGEIT